MLEMAVTKKISINNSTVRFARRVSRVRTNSEITRNLNNISKWSKILKNKCSLKKKSGKRLKRIRNHRHLFKRKRKTPQPKREIKRKKINRPRNSRANRRKR